MNPICTVIAEAGVNHNGSVDLAYRLVDAAAQARASYVKFQTFRAEKLVTRLAPKANYQKQTSGAGESQFEMLKRLELPLPAFRDIAAYCGQRDIAFLSTPFDAESAVFLAGVGMKALKVSSGDLTDIPFLRELGAMRLPIFLSTGMAKLGEVEDALETLEAAGTPLERITVLHCTTEYPAPIEEVNLRAMLALGSAFPRISIGYSDHTEGIDIPIAAAALGARVIEKHLTLDRSMEGPDHRASLEAPEFARMVESVRRVTAALGDGRKRPTPSELPNRLIARKSIVASRPIAKGEPLSPENLTVRRPGAGISPAQWDRVVGTLATRAYAADEPI
ncbi:N-acetylneuraminate synthase [Trinickia violacea]|uniref:N-acetylneuraminate synthase n=1 Tax=Trinickia violacea TaxID=2571746 RepID=A0A4P8IYI2_9BURK|nr:N-acetylneuraminate synthase [Trinickia violacea]QCP53487.1 N-acetylneuraminate synthase [Trinickia violacea]